ncbi:uncharacterized protein LOC129984794 [Argiope bruennichi]|uniref:Paramyosin like protein n=1 Tax=Argiope bruennichi TaxID=94029 RepID=A0A8T0EPW3_ARGBR|nr:uncharacterized protein LOC129984794 [Argiope bruennichi]KAF8774696.1 Paramyosin like protein [Argiope bruennichi]
MAPTTSSWRRPYTSIYNDNYRYGTGLYSDTLSDIEKRYSNSLSKTQLRSDRPDLAFTTFAGSTLTSSPTPGGDGTSSKRESLARQTSRTEDRSSRLESRLDATSYELDDEVQNVINRRNKMRAAMADSIREEGRRADEFMSREDRRPKSVNLYDDAAFFSLPKTTKEYSSDFDVESSLTTKRKVTSGGHTTSTNGPSSHHWREKSRTLQNQVESLENSISGASSKLQAELSNLKSKYHSEVTDLSSIVDNTSQQVSDLQKLCKRQANQLLELQSAYEDAQRNIQDILLEVDLWQNKCKSLKKEMDRLRQDVELALTKKSKD